MNQLSEAPLAMGSIRLLRSLGPLLEPPSGSLGQSLWWRHAPFANWLLASARPRRAAGEGEAFRALQALASAAGLVTEWSGAAASEPVDLLVLDGRWTEAETGSVIARWKPRLAAGAAVLVHGINPGEGGSLLWRDWSQGLPLSQLEFTDGAGLGMLLCDGASAPGILRQLCALQPQAAADFKALCAALGARWTACQQAAVAAMAAAESGRSLDTLRRHNEALGLRLDLQQAKLDTALTAERTSRQEERERMLAQMSAAALAHADKMARLSAGADAAARETALAHAGEMARLSAEADAAAREMALAHAGEMARLSARAGAAAQAAALAHAGEIALLSARADMAAREMALVHAETLARLSARADAAERAMAKMTASTTWRAAQAIARMAGSLPVPLRIAGRRAARLAWWVMTGQLPARLRRRLRARRRLPLLRNSPLFDPAWYAATYPDVASSGLDPTFHFAIYGAPESRKPGPEFDMAWYRRRYPEVAVAGIHPLLHFLEHGAAEGREWRAVPTVPLTAVAVDAAPVAAESVRPPLAPLPVTPAPVTPLEGAKDAGPIPVEPVTLPPAPIPDTTAAPLVAAEMAAGPSAPEDDAAQASNLSVNDRDPSSAPHLLGRDASDLSVNEQGASSAPHLLGRDLPAITIFPVTVGFVTRGTPVAELRRALESAETALAGIGQLKPGSLVVSDDSATVDPSGFIPWTVSCFPPAGVPGFAAAHNRMMEAAFAAGVEVYIAAHPGGVLHPDALIGLLRMVRANFRRALVEAARSPAPVPRPVDPQSYAVPWSCGACLAIPRQIYQAIGGFDERLESWGADVDLSWRARAAGFASLTCPDAVFHLPFRDGAEGEIPAAVLASGVLLARKWRLTDAQALFAAALERAGENLPDVPVEALPAAVCAIADFGAGPFLDESLW